MAIKILFNLEASPNPITVLLFLYIVPQLSPVTFMLYRWNLSNFLFSSSITENFCIVLMLLLFCSLSVFVPLSLLKENEKVFTQQVDTNSYRETSMLSLPYFLFLHVNQPCINSKFLMILINLGSRKFC